MICPFAASLNNKWPHHHTTSVARATGGPAQPDGGGGLAQDTYVKSCELWYGSCCEGTERTDDMTQGTIKSIRDDRGFGFIAPDGANQDVFFHSSSVEGGTFDSLREGQRVQFQMGSDPRNPGRSRAEHVQLLINE